MPKLDIGLIDYRSLPSDAHQQYLLRMSREQQKYYWMMFFIGGGIFLLSAVL